MPKCITFFIWTLLLACPLFTLNAQDSGQYAEIISITHVCNGNDGAITMELIGDTNNYTYWWEHGADGLTLTELAPGIYTFFVQHTNGCIEEYAIEILELDACTIEYEVRPRSKCAIEISVQVFSNGTPINETALDIQWSDGSSLGLNRVVYMQGDPTSYTITVSSNDNCCMASATIDIEGDPNCKEKEAKVIVNEFNRNKEGAGQFVELLVYGDGSCNEVFDLRGFHVDDNNGDLIPANEFVNEFNYHNIGITEGFISFRQHDNWAAVPNGSLIVIYSENHGLLDFPADDPTDANDDGVYILPANSNEYFTGKSSGWDANESVQIYEGELIAPDWSKIEINSGADGMQVRNPDGTYSHGVSLGQTAFSAENEFELWITSNNSNSCNCRFMLEDFLTKEDFSCDEAEEVSNSPGVANSPENQSLINSLLDCEEGRIGAPSTPNETRSGTGTSIPTSAVTKGNLAVYPNPFQHEVQLEFKAVQVGEAQLSLHLISGQIAMQQQILCEEGKNSYRLKMTDNVPAGIFILQFTFPSGETEFVRVIHMK